MRNILIGVLVGLALGVGLFLSIQDYLRTKDTVKAIVSIIQQSQQAQQRQAQPNPVTPTK